uniref:Uncharacterized protein n=1 Tax=Oryza punctata TaxID=4537 RepID=A0A0E0JGR2_ORYPU
MAGGEATAAPPEIPTRCHHCAGPLSKDMVCRKTIDPDPHRSRLLLRPGISPLAAGARGLLLRSTPLQASWVAGWLAGNEQLDGASVGSRQLLHGTSSYCLLFCMCWVSRWDNTSACTAGIIILSLSHSVILLCPHNFS